MKDISNIEIVRLLPAQWQEYKEIRLRALQSEPQAFASSFERESAFPDEKWQQRLEAVGKGTSWSLFAKNSAGKLVGMIGGYRDENDLKIHSAQIFAVYVESEERGKGIGKALMKEIIRELESVKDIKTIALEVNGDQASATALYEVMGFKKVGEPYPHLMGDGIEHQIVKMQRQVANKN